MIHKRHNSCLQVTVAVDRSPLHVRKQDLYRDAKFKAHSGVRLIKVGVAIGVAVGIWLQVATTNKWASSTFTVNYELRMRKSATHAHF